MEAGGTKQRTGSVGLGRSAGGAAASGHATVSGRWGAGTGLLTRCAQGVASIGSSKSSGDAKSGKGLPTKGRGFNLTRGSSPGKGSPSKGASGGGDSASSVPQRSSPTGATVPGRAVVSRNHSNGGGSTAVAGPSAKLGAAKGATAALRADVDEPTTPSCSRPTPMLPSQRNASKQAESPKQMSRVTGALAAVREARNEAQRKDEALRSDRVVLSGHGNGNKTAAEAQADADEGYTYMPINQEYPGARMIASPRAFRGSRGGGAHLTHPAHPAPPALARPLACPRPRHPPARGVYRPTACQHRPSGLRGGQHPH
jgi:hypothetical protein